MYTNSKKIKNNGKKKTLSNIKIVYKCEKPEKPEKFVQSLTTNYNQ